MKKFYTSYEGFAIRTVGYTTVRTASFLYFYDWFNKDPRRYARPEMLLYTAIPAALITGVLTNPFELVFTWMQAEPMYHKNYRRGYNTFWEGLLKANEEKALFWGAISNGLRIAMLLGTMTGLHDWMKEHAYYTLGPSEINRLLATIFATTVGTLASMPFDTLRTRMYLMKPLPNGALPYRDAWDCFNKITRFETTTKWKGNFGAFYAGALTQWLRLLVIFLVS